MKKIFSIILILILGINITYADSSIREESDNINYDLYNERVENNCSDYNDSSNVINIDEDYKQAYEYITQESLNPGYTLDTAIDKYKSDMNSIYNCGIINLKINSNNLIMEKLDTNSTTVKELEEQFKTENSKLELLYKNYSCTNIDNSVNQKALILKQTTYETCKYNYYMEYLKSFYENQNLDIDYSNDDGTTSYTGQYITAYNNYVNGFKKTINDEISRAYYLFPITYHAYLEFENYYPIHILLVLLKQDFINFRLYFYKAINPINQVVYKIANAMSNN